MEKILRPERFDVLPSASGANKAWLHWKRTLTSFLATAVPTPRAAEDGNAGPAAPAVNKLDVLFNLVSSSVYEFISECVDFDTAIATLEALYIVPKNEVFARHLLATRNQQPGESLDTFLNALKLLAKDCQFKDVTAEVYRQELVRDAFINGLQVSSIRQRLLENTTLSLTDAFTQARSLELAQKSNEQYHSSINISSLGAMQAQGETLDNLEQTQSDGLAAAVHKPPVRFKRSCGRCGGPRHHRLECPAKDSICYGCGKVGHLESYCRTPPENQNPRATQRKRDTSSAIFPSLSIISNNDKPKTIVDITIKEQTAKALLDTGSLGSSYISKELAVRLKLDIKSRKSSVSLAQPSFKVNIPGYVRTDIELNNTVYPNVELLVMDKLCTDVIIGTDILKEHKSVVVEFGGSKPPLHVCNATMNIEPPPVFTHITSDCKPICAPSRRYSKEDREFIHSEVERLLKLGKIKPSNSPWRAQVVVVRDNEKRRKRLTVDYSQTINKYSLVDAYPLPRIDDQVNEISKNQVFSTIDLKEAYHQIPLREEEQLYTAFEADGKLYQFTVLPNGVNNGVPCFQREMDNFVERNELQKTYPYLDNITICGADQAEHDTNYIRTMEACKKEDVELNEKKSVVSVPTIKVLGHEISHNSIKPDPDRLAPLRDMPPPPNLKLQKKVVGMFAYYSKWIPNSSEKIKPLSSNTVFPLPAAALKAFNLLKAEVENSVVATIDEDKHFTVETDASDYAIAATLCQEGRPVAFFSRTVQPEMSYPTVEKEATAIIESVRYWKHYLTTKHFTLITDQKSVHFMLDGKRRNKIKNDKIYRWRVELSCYDFDIRYRPGEENVPADLFSRVLCSIAPNNKKIIIDLHDHLGGPGVTRLYHYLKTKNIPVSVDEVREALASCGTCTECKPQLVKPTEKKLVKATQPFERVSIDFKGPLPSVSQNKYMLTATDEFSRFPFAIPCQDVSAPTVIKGLSSIFTIFGLPGYVHSDRGPSFMSKELKDWIHSKGVPTSRTSPYNPRGNGQCERYNATIWTAVVHSCKTRGVDVKHWESVLPDALHGIRSLLCTATNTTPHERMFNFQRRSASGESIPSWLNPGPVFLKQHVRKSKYDPSVVKVELLEANPNYAHVRHPDGRESTVSLRDVAPYVPAEEVLTRESVSDRIDKSLVVEPHTPDPSHLVEAFGETCTVPVSESLQEPLANDIQQPTEFTEVRRSTRVRKEPDRLDL